MLSTHAIGIINDILCVTIFIMLKPSIMCKYQWHMSARILNIKTLPAEKEHIFT